MVKYEQKLKANELSRKFQRFTMANYTLAYLLTVNNF